MQRLAVSAQHYCSLPSNFSSVASFADSVLDALHALHSSSNGRPPIARALLSCGLPLHAFLAPLTDADEHGPCAGRYSRRSIGQPHVPATPFLLAPHEGHVWLVARPLSARVSRDHTEVVF